MKKSIVLTLIIALVLAMTSSVFAAEDVHRAVTVTLSAPASAQVGEQITVKVHFGETVSTALAYVNYKGAQLRYVSSDLATAKNEDGRVKLDIRGLEVDDVNITFEVLASGELGLNFSNRQLVAASDRAALDPVELPTATVNVAGTPTDEPGGDTPDQPKEPAAEEKEESGKPGSYPKTGVNYVVAGGVLLSLISLVAVAKKM